MSLKTLGPGWAGFRLLGCETTDSARVCVCVCVCACVCACVCV